MLKNVKQYTRNCRTCHLSKYFRNRYSGVLKSLPVPSQRWRDVSIDFVVELPPSLNMWNVECKNIMVITDRLSKDVVYEPINDLTPQEVAKAYYYAVFQHHGIPESVVSDRGRQFASDFWDELTMRLGVIVRMSTAFHPQTDGQTEIANAIMEQYLRIYCAYLQGDWAKWLPSAAFCTKNHYSESTRITPFFANHGYHPRMGLEPPQELSGPPRTDRERRKRLHADGYVEKIEQINQELQAQIIWAQGWQEEYANRHRDHASRRQIGDLIYLDARNFKTRRPAKKLSNKNEDPFEITQVVSPHAYRLKLPDIWGCHNVFHSYLLHDAANDPLPGQAPPVPMSPKRLADNELFDIVRIHHSQSNNGQVEYLVTYDGADKEWWVKFDDCLTAPELIEEFHTAHPKSVGEDSWHAYQRRIDGNDLEYIDHADSNSDTDG